MSESNDANARLKSERDAARGEAEDFRRAWAILREDENQRMPATAEEGARQFRAEFDTVRADLEKAHEEIKRLSIEALKAGNRAHNELAETQRDLEKARARTETLTTALRAALIGWKNEVDMGDGFPETEAPIYEAALAALSETP